MTLGSRGSAFPTDGRSRLRMREAASPSGAADGTWWPRSTGLVDQLPAVLTELWERLGGVERVVYNPLAWPGTPARIAVRGRLVHLVASRTQDADSIDLVSATTRRATTLMVVPVESSAQAAEAAAGALLSGSGISSRFIGAGVDRVPDQGRASRPGHEAGESFRARAAEELHTAGERAQAVRTVAGHAVDAADCEMLLSVLGLDALVGAEPGEI
jgi:Family of unknown function (DUF5994)